MIKVLYVSDNLFQRYGVTAVMMNYFRNIDREKVQIDFLVWEGNDEEIENEIRANGSCIYYMPKLGLKNYMKVKKFFIDFFSAHKNEYAIVHSHFCQMDSIVFPIAKKSGVIHCISHSHNTKLSDYRIRAIRNRLMCLPITKVADTMAACSEEAGDALFGRSFKKSRKKLIIRNGIDCERFEFNEDVRRKLRKELGIGESIVIGNVGSCKPQKNQKFLLEVFQKLLHLSNDGGYRLLLIGDGDLRAELENKAKKLGIADKVIFLGQRRDVNELMSAMDVFVLPSLYEGLGLVLIEAQASGLRCLASGTVPLEAKVSENIEYLELDKGAEYWAERIRNCEYLCNSERVGYRARLREKGYDIMTESKRLADFYMSCVDGVK